MSFAETFIEVRMLLFSHIYFVDTDNNEVPIARCAVIWEKIKRRLDWHTAIEKPQREDTI